MGYGTYSISGRAKRSAQLNYSTKDIGEIFGMKSLDNGMNPKNISVRESRDSDEHPNSVPIILGLDVTGSMGEIPHSLVKEGLPKIMGRIMEVGIDDPQVLFLGIGDDKYDRAPLQVGQFESSDELLDKWLTSLFLEGGGGGNGGESYSLAWYFAAFKTSTDSYEKRGKKGIVITIGDEPVHRELGLSSIKNIIGEEERSYLASELLELAKERYHVFHIHIIHGVRSADDRVIGGWKELMGDNLVLVKDSNEISSIIPELIIKKEGLYKKTDATIDFKNKEEIIL